MEKKFRNFGLVAAVQLILGAFAARVAAALAADSAEDGKERGDVPGWVMITLMSAVLVAALLAVAGPALEDLFLQAINQVKP
jgi:hypothetical protein